MRRSRVEVLLLADGFYRYRYAIAIKMPAIRGNYFDPQGHCLFAPQAVRDAFAGWEIHAFEQQDLPAPHESVKAFVTIVARKPRATA